MKPSIFPALALLTGVALGANTVSWNLDNNSTIGGDGAGDEPPTTEEAGLVRVGGWTNSWPSNITTDLRDDTGLLTTVDISYSSSAGSYPIQVSHPGQDSDGSWNKELLNGYLNSGGGENSSVTFSQIPYTSYDVYVYFSSDVADREGSVTDGTSTFYFRTIGADSIAGADAVLTQATDTTDDVQDEPANYAVFTGIEGASVTVTVDIPDFGGIAAVQIVGSGLPGAPVVLDDPQDASVAVDGVTTLSATVSADPAPDYQWEFSADGNPPWTELDGEINATLEVFFAELSQEGYYRVVASNVNGSATSEPAFLEVFYAEPEFFEQPASAYVLEGSTVELVADAFTYGMPGYQWYKDGEPLPGETTNTLVLTNIGPAEDGDYFLRVTDDIEPGVFGDSAVASVFTYPAWEGLVSHEPFSTGSGYALDELPAQDPAIDGYVGPWVEVDFGDAQPEVMSGSLLYPDPLYLGSSGDQAGKTADTVGIGADNSGRTYRELAPALVVAENTTGVRYLSWLYRNGNENAPDAAPTVYSTLALFNGDTADANRYFEGGVADDAALGPNLMCRINNDVGAVGDFGAIDDGVHLFVVKFDLSDQFGSDTVTVWVDPELGSGEPVGGSLFEFREIVFDRIVLSDYASNSSAWDEIRWGSTFDSVTLNPNPGSDYAAWIAGFDVSGLTGFNDDPDGDGLCNGLENFLGTDPSVPNPGVAELSRSGNTVSFQHPQNAVPASDVTAAYRWSPDLDAWNADGGTSAGTTVDFVATPNSPTAGTTTVTATIGGTVPARLFVDLQVTQGAP